jgi:hypothetical protein
VELGAKCVVGVNALAEMPSSVLKPFVLGFRAAFGHHPVLPENVRMVTIAPAAVLGSVTDALKWKQANVNRWIEEGRAAAKNISIPNCFWR